MKTTSSILLFFVLPVVVCCCTAPLPYKFPVGPSMEEFIEHLGGGLRAEGGGQSRRAVPAVRNRDARGRFLMPACPLCGGETVLTCTTYRCAKNHKYETPDIELNP